MITGPSFFWLLLTVAYLLGGIPFSAIVTRLKGVDLTAIGSGNFGATNVYRALGFRYALLVFALDACKGALATWWATTMFESLIIHIVVGFVAIFGHSFSLFLGFKGGKGVATAAGVFSVITPIPFGITFVAVIAVIYATRMVSVGTLLACVLLPVLLVVFNEPMMLVRLVGIIAGFIIWRHRGNISRILKGTEHKIS